MMARICLIRQYHYPLDPRVRREAEALEALGHEVDVICLRREDERWRERRGLITAYRLPFSRRRGGPLRYLFEYGAFLLAAAALLTALHMRRRYRLVQVHTMPDALVFAAVGPRLMGARVLLDLHECMPEFFATKFNLSFRHPAVRLVALAEQASIRFAHRSITCTDQMREAFVGRGAPADRIAVVLNAADETLFDPARYPPSRREPGRLRLICHGSVERLYGLDTAIRAVALLRSELPGLSLEIYGEGAFLPELQELARRLDVTDVVYFSERFVPMPQLLAAISGADVGVVAMRSDAFRDLVHCNKMYDFLAMQKPIVCSRTRSVEAYFDEGCFQFFRADDEEDLARAIRRLYDEPDLGERLVRRAAEVSEAYRWTHQRRIYQAVVADLLRGDRRATAAGAAELAPNGGEAA
jgi:glycosyltransferase involved in cell wall biosynthesis